MFKKIVLVIAVALSLLTPRFPVQASPDEAVREDLPYECILPSGSSQAGGQPLDRQQLTANYTIQPGDNLLAIACRFSLDKSTLCAVNHVSDENLILAGQVLTIPGASIHKVTPGETLADIAKQAGVDLWKLAGANKITAPDLIKAGDSLLIPPAGNDSVQAWAGNNFHWPLSGYSEITSPFGWRIIFGRRQFHQGIDIGCPVGTPVESASSGTVTWVGWENPSDHRQGYGFFMTVQDGTKEYVYGHLTPNSNMARVGDSVRTGQIVAKSGETGDSTGPHLHFGVDLTNIPGGGSSWINPLSVLKPPAS